MHVVRDNEPLEFGVRYNLADKKGTKFFGASAERTGWIAQQAGIKVVSFINPKRLMK
jgi:hypothetical protein